MNFTKKNYQSVESKGNLRFLRKPLKLQNHGFSVLETENAYKGMTHDHKDKDQEEVYFLVEGQASLEIEGETVEMVPGDAVRVPSKCERTLRTDGEAMLVITGAP